MTDLLFSNASRRRWLKQGAVLSLAAAGSLRDGILPVRVDVRAITDTQVWKRAT